ncbi:MAG TPA: cyclic nucleotide-binding domain-containing protein [Anaerolineae bacterium]
MEDENKSGDRQEADRDLARALPRLTPAQVAEVSPKFVRMIYAPGEVIIRQDDLPDRFYIIIRGRAEILHQALSGRTQRVEVREAGEYFGEIGLLHNRPRTATVRASEEGEVEVLALDRQDFEELIDESRATESQVALEMTQRLIRLADFQE